MKTALRSLFVWLLLLALPLQGMAAARMLPYMAGAPVSASAPRHHAMQGDPMAAMHCAFHAAHANAHMPTGAGHGPHDNPSGGHGGSCASCCIAVALAPAAPTAPALAPPDFIAIPFRAGHVTSVDPALPERPPRTSFA